MNEDRRLAMGNFMKSVNKMLDSFVRLVYIQVSDKIKQDIKVIKWSLSDEIHSFRVHRACHDAGRI